MEMEMDSHHEQSTEIAASMRWMIVPDTSWQKYIFHEKPMGGAGGIGKWRVSSRRDVLFGVQSNKDLLRSAGRRRYRGRHLPIPVGDKHFDVT